MNNRKSLSCSRFVRLLATLRQDERGVVLVFALVLMLVLTIIGASMTMTSQVDVTISGNTKVIREAFYVSEAGIEMSPKVLARIIDDRSLPKDSTTVPLTDAETPLLTFDSVNLLGKVLGYIKTDDPSNNPPDIQMTSGLGGTVTVDIQRGRTAFISGGGVEFAAGTEGVGVGGVTSTAIYYDFDSIGNAGRAPALTSSRVMASYRKVVGVAGGI